MTSSVPGRPSDELISYLTEVKDKLDGVVRSQTRFDLTVSEAIELAYNSQRIDYYLKMFAGKREPSPNN